MLSIGSNGIVVAPVAMAQCLLVTASHSVISSVLKTLQVLSTALQKATFKSHLATKKGVCQFFADFFLTLSLEPIKQRR